MKRTMALKISTARICRCEGNNAGGRAPCGGLGWTQILYPRSHLAMQVLATAVGLDFGVTMHHDVLTFGP